MREITGYYDGTAAQLLKPAPKKKQKVIVTFIDDELKINEFQNIRSTQRIINTIEVVAEVVYVLTKVYDVSREDTSSAILHFLKSRNIVCSNNEVAVKALQLFAENHLDFMDNVLLAYHQLRGITINSYDRKLMNAISRMDSDKTE